MIVINYVCFVVCVDIEDGIAKQNAKEKGKGVTQD